MIIHVRYNMVKTHCSAAVALVDVALPDAAPDCAVTLPQPCKRSVTRMRLELPEAVVEPVLPRRATMNPPCSCWNFDRPSSSEARRIAGRQGDFKYGTNVNRPERSKTFKGRTSWRYRKPDSVVGKNAGLASWELSSGLSDGR